MHGDSINALSLSPCEAEIKWFCFVVRRRCVGSGARMPLSTQFNLRVRNATLQFNRGRWSMRATRTHTHTRAGVGRNMEMLMDTIHPLRVIRPGKCVFFQSYSVPWIRKLNRKSPYAVWFHPFFDFFLHQLSPMQSIFLRRSPHRLGKFPFIFNAHIGSAMRLTLDRMTKK